MAAEVLLALTLTLANGTTTDDTPYSKADSLMAAFEKADRQERIAVANEIFVHYKQIGLTDFDIADLQAFRYRQKNHICNPF